MSQTKTGASRFQGRLFKSAATSALALSALTGGLILSGGEGKAASFCTSNGPDGNMIPGVPGPASCTVEDPNLGFPPKVQQTTATILPYPPSNPIPPLPPGTNVNYELTSLFYPLAQTQIDTDFNAPYAGGLLVGPTYTVQGLNGTKIDGIDLSAAGIGAFTVKKEVFSDSTLTTKIAELNLTGAGFVPVIPLSPISQIWIRDTYNNPVAGQSSIDNVENTVRTPGPLAILGAGTAFGFSRKLRGRIKASRTA
jgi:hypothetical protein